MKRTPFYIIIVPLLLLAGCTGKNGPDRTRLPDMQETYRKNDKKPFGAYVAYQMLEQLYPDNIRRAKKEPIEKTSNDIADTSALYISISRDLFTSDEDVTGIMELVAAGNEVLLAAANFDNNLLEEIGCKFANTGEYLQLITKHMRDTEVKLRPRYRVDSSGFGYFYKPFTNYFYDFDSSATQVLGYNDKGNPDFIVYFHGKGKLFLHCDPRAFSNYFLLQRENYKYMQMLMGYTRPDPQHLYWNDYYVNVSQKRSGGGSGGRKKGSNNNDRSGSTFSGLKGPLWTAFWIALTLLLLYILYGIKRKQRAIAQVKPNENTTVTFTETIGLLYLQKKDNRNIADKMITYFNEFIRNQYFLNTSQVNDAFMTTLSRKSGVPLHRVESLCRAISHAQQSTTIDDYQLLSLNEQIQNFYKYRN